ncbi:hypothetical protein J1C51_22265 [Chromobacterium haemolyticum]|uniref:hypothetical protein n=1 Tax=Chromobacterium haemolyticum TaxID=394935 RepID=UPI001A93709A|nr:hypothetical protein [Chromobacterium haemolyticum]MBO0501499.1 hypothetical protein [Chromobacterium haemolyticum]
MISRPRKLLGLVPFAAAWLLSDKTASSFLVMLVGGLVIWVPYWLAWWLSDGFSIFNGPAPGIDDDPVATGYRWGSQGYGYYQGSHRVH